MPNTTIAFYTTQTSATGSIWRILKMINGSMRSLHEPGNEAFGQEASFRFDWADVPRDGQLIMANAPIFNKIHGLKGQDFIVNFRDPRDRICNEYSWHLVHPKFPNEPMADIEARAVKAREMGVDAFIRQWHRAGPLQDNDYFQMFMSGVRRIPIAQRHVITYARLCLDYDSFIERCCAILGVELTPELKVTLEVERTEKIDQNRRWIGTIWKGSDTAPGRYKRELAPETIEMLTGKYAPILRAMARLDPEYADLYLEGVTSSM